MLAERAYEARETAAAEEAAQQIGSLAEELRIAARRRAAQLGQKVGVGVGDRVGNFLRASGRRSGRPERGEDCGKRGGDQFLGDRLVDADRSRQATDHLRRKKLLHETDKIDCHCDSPRSSKERPEPFIRLSSASRAPPHRKISCGDASLDLRRANSYPHWKMNLPLAWPPPATRTIPEKTRTSSPRFCLPGLVQRG